MRLIFAALKGSGNPPTPAGLLNQADVYIHGSVGAVTDYSEIAAQAAKIRGYNFEPNAFLWNAKTSNKFRTLQDTLHQPLRAPVTVPETDYVTNQLADGEMYIGQWDQLAMGLRSGLQIETSREASYMDGSQSPATLVSSFSKDQTIFRLRHPPATGKRCTATPSQSAQASPSANQRAAITSTAVPPILPCWTIRLEGAQCKCWTDSRNGW